MHPTKIILLACGSFNPPTNMHFRMFELARDHLHRLGNYEVIGGIMSPVHDLYAKKDLVSATHRCEMLRVVLRDSDWIRLSSWECTQEQWCTTRQVLEYHQNQLTALKETEKLCDVNNKELSWLPEVNLSSYSGQIRVKLLCGADLLESFAVPGLWKTEDLSAIIGDYGLVVVTRENSHPEKFIYESDLLTNHLGKIIIVKEWMRNDISSTKIRRALRRSESVKYIIHDAIINYVHANQLYGATNDSKYITTPSKDKINNNLITPEMGFDTPVPSNDTLMNLNLCCHPGRAIPSDDQTPITHAVSSNSTPSHAPKTLGGSLDARDASSSCVKFVLTTQGIEVISDIETIL